MSKPKNPGKFEDFVAPWETKADDGTVTVGEIDSDKLKKYLHNLLTDKFNAETAEQAAVAAKTTAESELVSEKAKHETAEQTKAREAEEAKAAADKAKEGERDLKVWRLEVALEKGLTAGQAARLVGATKDELLTDADGYLAEIGGGEGESDNGDDQGVPSRNPLGITPRVPNSRGSNDSGDDSDPATWVTSTGHNAFVL